MGWRGGSGVRPGDQFSGRAEMRVTGQHGKWMGGIDFITEEVHKKCIFFTELKHVHRMFTAPLILFSGSTHTFLRDEDTCVSFPSFKCGHVLQLCTTNV